LFGVNKVDGKPLKLSAVAEPKRDGDRLTLAFRHVDSNLEVTAHWELHKTHRAAVLQLKLANCASEVSRAFSALKPVFLRLKRARKMKAKLRSLPGGQKLCYYPPRAYQDRVVAVAESGGFAAFRIESGPDGRSSRN
jgi:hypothetical protein